MYLKYLSSSFIVSTHFLTQQKLKFNVIPSPILTVSYIRTYLLLSIYSEHIACTRIQHRKYTHLSLAQISFYCKTSSALHHPSFVFFLCSYLNFILLLNNKASRGKKMQKPKLLLSMFVCHCMKKIVHLSQPWYYILVFQTNLNDIDVPKSFAYRLLIYDDILNIV